MTDTSPSPVLDAVVRVAVEGTRASRGRLLVGGAAAAELGVASALGGDAAWHAATRVTEAGVVAFVLATGQPQILSSRGVGAAEASPLSALCAPCIQNDEAVGVLELADKAGGGSFSFDDLELASLLAGIAAEAIVARQPPTPIAPGDLASQLQRLAVTDPLRGAAVARLVHILLHD